MKLHTLIFHPRHDDQSDIKNTMALQRKLGGMVEVSVLDDSYHLVTLDRQRGYVVERTMEFVDRLLARQSDKVAEMQKPARPRLIRSNWGRRSRAAAFRPWLS